MRPTWLRTEEQDGNQPDIRWQLIKLIQKRKRTSKFTKERPTDVRPGQIIHPDSGLYLTDIGMWAVIVALLEAGVPLKRVSLRDQPGEKAWELLARLCPDAPLIYMKLQIRGSHVLLRSFHEAKYDDD